ncbi:HD domain-containing protein [Actinophytocola sp.]|uniref:HD domain-containing protein n=1 Tax=Actinophytocola sp. TaxID=1872138 RepID=UPI003D6BC8C6
MNLAGDPLLTERNPLPATLDPRIAAQLTFLIEVDRLKTVLRQSPLVAAQRRENDAEHSWHLALMVILLAEHADEPVDVGHTVKLVVVHDLVEIYAGDTPLYDDVGARTQEERERAAADLLFGLLPAGQARELRALWDEFEARETPESRFAKAMDRLEPLLLNWMARGGTWQTPGVTADVVRARKAHIGAASAVLGETARIILDEGERRGWVRSPEHTGDGRPAAPPA